MRFWAEYWPKYLHPMSCAWAIPLRNTMQVTTRAARVVLRMFRTPVLYRWLTLSLRKEGPKKSYHLLFPVVGVLGFCLYTRKNIAHLDLGDYCFFPQYKTKEDAYHWLKYYYRHADLTLIEEAVKTILRDFYKLSITEGEQQILEGMLIALFKNNEDVVAYWLEQFEPFLTSREEKLTICRALRQSGLKHGQEYLKNVTGVDTEEIEEIMKLPVLDLRDLADVSYKDIVGHLQMLRGMFAITKDERIIQHMAQMAGGWKTETLTDELNLEKFFVAMKARNTLVHMNYEYDCLHDILENYSVIFDGQTREALKLQQ